MFKVYNLLINVKEEKKNQLDIKISNGKTITIGLIKKWCREDTGVFSKDPFDTIKKSEIMGLCDTYSLEQMQKDAFNKMYDENNRVKRTPVSNIYRQVSFASDTETFTEKKVEKTQKVLSVGYQFVNYRGYRKLYSMSYEEKKYFTENAIYETVFKQFHNNLNRSGYNQFVSTDGEDTSFISEFMENILIEVKNKPISDLESEMTQLEVAIREKSDIRFKNLKKDKFKEKVKEVKEEIIKKHVLKNIGKESFDQGFIDEDILKICKKAIKQYKADTEVKILFHNARFDITTLYDTSHELRKNFTLTSVTEPEGSILSHVGM